MIYYIEIKVLYYNNKYICIVVAFKEVKMFEIGEYCNFNKMKQDIAKKKKN